MTDFSTYKAYAIYRLPFADEAFAICQKDDREIAACERAFIMMPFDGSRHKTIRIAPDVELRLNAEELHTDKRGELLELISDPKAYNQAFTLFQSVIPDRFQKLVLSRCVTSPYKSDPLDVFRRACMEYPRTMVYLVYTEETGYWLGSSPEILIAGNKSHYKTAALAGTMTSDGPWTYKNQKEQAFVADYISETIAPLCNYVEEEGPYTSRAGNLYHIKTEFHFTLLPDVCISDFINQLSPTPAVCGLPKDEAKAFILANEGYDRKYYSGVVGMLDEDGETNLYVNLRCCNIKDGEVTLYAGGGILYESMADNEYTETEEKLKTMEYVL